MNEINIAWLSWVEQRLRRSLIDHNRRRLLLDRLEVTQDENEVKTILLEAENNQPLMGRDIWPQGQKEEMKEAIQNRCDIDDFYDRTIQNS